MKKLGILGILLSTSLLLAACQSSNGKPEFEPADDKVEQSEKKEKKEKSSESSSEESSSSTEVSSETSQKIDESPKKTVEGLPKDASEAPTDKIYATGNAKVYYVSYGSGKGFEAQIPDFTGYTPDKVKEVLGQPQEVLENDSATSQTLLDQTELDNIKRAFQSGSITEEQAKAFRMGSFDLVQAIKLGSQYTIYTYNNRQQILVFDEGQLYYMTPDTQYLSFK
ncbi:DUF4947 domain-containing protein [Streptococcus pluranimalium]|uniref:DUF4947 domain-containing protein n=1 Tax=Streptococcus pluranimalium TaxID=82348 RepID=UPI002931E87C|nr:DUF4947 domain-containing protein [Streptococcus pluranimalium]MDY3041674.1 DUF4947 domain-containing protein [Streptococcus pluranimalium]